MLGVAAALLLAAAAAEVAGRTGAPPRLEQISLIGCAECETPARFARIMDIAISMSGEVFVLDRMEPYVRVFHPHGEIEFAVGARGQGPGEFETPLYLVLHPDRSFSVFDGRTIAFTRFDEAGRYMRRTRMDRLAMRVTYDQVGGTVLWRERNRLGPGTLIRRWNGNDGEGAATLLELRNFPLDARGVPSQNVGLALAPDGRFAVASGNPEYLIKVFSENASLVHEIRREIERPERSPEDIEARREEILRRLGAVTVDIDPLDAHFYPAGVRFDGGGRLWVRTRRDHLDGTTFDVFDRAGGYLGEVRLADRLQDRENGFAFAGDLMAAVVFDELDNQRVKVWRVLSGN